MAIELFVIPFQQELHLVAIRSFFCSLSNGRTPNGHHIIFLFVIELRGTWWPPIVLFFVLDYNVGHQVFFSSWSLRGPGGH